MDYYEKLREIYRLINQRVTDYENAAVVNNDAETIRECEILHIDARAAFSYGMSGLHDLENPTHKEKFDAVTGTLTRILKKPSHTKNAEHKRTERKENQNDNRKS